MQQSVQSGWKLCGRGSFGKLAYAQKDYRNAAGLYHTQLHYENGWRFLKDCNDNTIMKCSPEGVVTRFDDATCRTLTWTKNNEGKYCWT